tara:strand:- start:117 stop:692 length:576 start_codon:yes stop_codon:yes gene_type:complete
MERMERKPKKKDVSDFAVTKKKIGPRDKSDFAGGFVPKKKRVRGPKVSVPGSMRGGPPQRVAKVKKKDVSDFAVTKKKIGPRDKSDFARGFVPKKKDVSDFAVNKKTKKTTPVKTSGTYKIKSGDTLSAIARNKGTTVATLKKLNNIKDANKIFAGRSLKLPSSNGTKKKKNMVKLVKTAVKKGRAMRAAT